MHTLTEIVISFRPYLYANVDCLETEFSINVGGYECLLKFPSWPMGISNENRALLAPLNTYYQKFDSNQSNKNPEWGIVVGDITAPVCVRLNAVVFAIKNLNQDEDNSLTMKLNSLIQGSVLLLDVLKRKISPIPKKYQTSPILRYTISSEGLQRHTTYVDGSYTSKKIHNEEGILLADFKKIIDYLKDGNLIPTEYKLFRQSLIYFTHGDRRLAIMEACTGLEMFLSIMIDKGFAKMKLPKSLKNGVLSKYRTLGGLVQLSAISGFLTYPKDFKQKVTELRNSVIHDGYTPSPEEAETCLDYIEDVMYSNSQHPIFDILS